MKNIHILPTDKPSRLRKTKHNNFFLANRIGYEYTDCTAQHIYITSNEVIKEGVDQWYLDKVLNKPYNSGGAQYSSKQEVIILTTDVDLIADGVQQIDDEFLEWFVKNPSCEWVETESLNIGNGKLGYVICKPQNLIPKEEPKPHSFCETPNEKCTMNYCDENGCMNRKRELVEPKQETLTYSEAAKKEERLFNSTMIFKQETLEEAAKIHHNTFTRDLSFAETRRESFIEDAKWQQEQQDQFAIKFAVWLSANCLQDTTKDGWWLYQKTLLTTDECLAEFKYEHLNGNA